MESLLYAFKLALIVLLVFRLLRTKGLESGSSLGVFSFVERRETETDSKKGG